MTSTEPPDQSINTVAGKLFGMITAQLEVAYEISTRGHRPERGHEHMMKTIESVRFQLIDIITLVEAIEALLPDDH